MPDSPYQIANRHKIDEYRGKSHHRMPLHQLINLERYERRSRDDGQILRPSCLMPEPDAFDHEERRVQQCADTELLNVTRIEIVYAHERLLDVWMCGAVRQRADPPIEHVARCRVEKLERPERNRDKPSGLQKFEDRDHLDQLVPLAPVVRCGIFGQVLDGRIRV